MLLQVEWVWRCVAGGHSVPTRISLGFAVLSANLQKPSAALGFAALSANLQKPSAALGQFW